MGLCLGNSECCVGCLCPKVNRVKAFPHLVTSTVTTSFVAFQPNRIQVLCLCPLSVPRIVLTSRYREFSVTTTTSMSATITTSTTATTTATATRLFASLYQQTDTHCPQLSARIPVAVCSRRTFQPQVLSRGGPSPILTDSPEFRLRWSAWLKTRPSSLLYIL